ncbi:MAG: toll/interleukin-1 receptor domain-containing protein [Cyanobacteria bacterium P01_A01_bin.37]
MSEPLFDFFISYNSADRAWAEWIAWVLEENKYRVIIQAWDIRPGSNFILEMQKATEAERTVMVLSDDYLKALYTQPEWAAAFKQDPTSEDRKLLPIRVAPCKPSGMLAPLVYVDLVGKAEKEAEHVLLDALKERAKPATRPAFPQTTVNQERVTPSNVAFPGASVSSDPSSKPAMSNSSASSSKKLSAIERLTLIRTLNDLPEAEFDALLGALDPPGGVVSGSSASQGTRTKKLMDWVEGSTGRGLAELLEVLSALTGDPH